jgi:hypothetical protein
VREREEDPTEGMQRLKNQRPNLSQLRGQLAPGEVLVAAFEIDGSPQTRVLVNAKSLKEASDLAGGVGNLVFYASPPPEERKPGGRRDRPRRRR